MHKLCINLLTCRCVTLPFGTPLLSPNGCRVCADALRTARFPGPRGAVGSGGASAPKHLFSVAACCPRARLKGRVGGSQRLSSAALWEVRAFAPRSDRLCAAQRLVTGFRRLRRSGAAPSRASPRPAPADPQLAAAGGGGLSSPAVPALPQSLSLLPLCWRRDGEGVSGSPVHAPRPRPNRKATSSICPTLLGATLYILMTVLYSCLIPAGTCSSLEKHYLGRFQRIQLNYGIISLGSIQSVLGTPIPCCHDKPERIAPRV